MNDVDQSTCRVPLGVGEVIVFRKIPAGEFRMGSRNGHTDEQPVHRVVIPQDFWLAETPVTQRQFACFDPKHQSHFHSKPHHPVEEVDWAAAKEFCRWLKQVRDQSPWPRELDDFHPNLPTEAQWEYACRAGTETDYYTGDGEQALARAGWYGADWGAGSTQPVGQKAQNDFGLFDMHGNVWEWCRDHWSEDAYRHCAEGRSEPACAGETARKADDGARVSRGGTWFGPADFCRSASRIRYPPGFGDRLRGFRVGLFPGPSCQGPEAK